MIAAGPPPGDDAPRGEDVPLGDDVPLGEDVPLGDDAPRGDGAPPGEEELTSAISAAIVDLYATHYGHHRTTATTYLNDTIVLCVLESILTREEDELIAEGSRGEVIDGRVAFQTETQDEFTVAVERLTQRHVTAFLSANQTTPGVACELFFLDAPPPLSPPREADPWQ